MPEAETLRYTDWQVATRHAEIVDEAISGLNLTRNVGKVQVDRHIPGVHRRRITQEFRAGAYIQPLKSNTVETYACTHDIARTSLLVIAVGMSTRQGDKESDISAITNRLRNVFASRRALMVNGELYSFIADEIDHDIDAQMARQYDFLILPLVSVLREDR